MARGSPRVSTFWQLSEMGSGFLGLLGPLRFTSPGGLQIDPEVTLSQHCPTLIMSLSQHWSWPQAVLGSQNSWVSGSNNIYSHGKEGHQGLSKLDAREWMYPQFWSLKAMHCATPGQPHSRSALQRGSSSRTRQRWWIRSRGILAWLCQIFLRPGR